MRSKLLTSSLTYPSSTMTTKAYLRRHLWLPVSGLSRHVLHTLKSALSGSEFGGHPLYHEVDDFLLIPRTLLQTAKDAGMIIEDERPRTFEHVPFTSSIQLDTRLPPGSPLVQQPAALAIRNAQLGGVVQLYCGAGKTIIALDAIAKEQMPAIVVADNHDLLRQWWGSAQRFLGLGGPIPLLKTDGAALESKGLVLSTYATLASAYTKGRVLPNEQRFAQVFFDEAHHVHASMYSSCAEAFSGKRIALTATPSRSDGLDILNGYHLGPLLHKNLRAPLTPRVTFVETGVQVAWTDSLRDEKSWSELAGLLGRDEARTGMLAQLLESLRVKRKVLILSASLTSLANLMLRMAALPFRVTGADGRPAAFLDALRKRSDIGVITAEVPVAHQNRKAPLTFAYRAFGREGYDDEELDTVLLLEPTADPGLLQQILGRPCRYLPGKDPWVLIAEDKLPALNRKCKEMRTLLDRWPDDAGGSIPYDRWSTDRVRRL